MDPESPLDRLDQYIASLAVAIGVVYVLSYAFYPHVLPTSARPGFLSFCAGLSTRQRVRSAKDTPEAPVAWPDSSGTPTYNVEGFATALADAWDPWGSRPLCNALVRKASVFYAFAHVVSLCQRSTGLLEPYFYSCVITFMGSADAPQHVGYKLALLSCLKFFLNEASERCLGTISVLACENPMSCGLRLLVLRKIHRLAPAGRAKTSAGDVQQAVHNALQLGNLLATGGFRSIVVDVLFCFYCMRSMWGLYGFSTLVIYFMVGCCVGLLSSAAFVSMHKSRQKTRDAELKRSEVINCLISAFRPLRSYDWVKRAADDLEETVATERTQMRRVSLTGCTAGALMILGTKFVVPVSYFISVFVRGGGVSFEGGLMMYANMGLMGFCMAAIAGCIGKWSEIQMRSSWLESFLRLPEREELPTLTNGDECKAGYAEIIGGTFVWPPARGKDDGDALKMPGPKDPGEGEQSAVETYEADEVALWMIKEGRYAGNWVPCRVEGADEASGLYTVAVLPTSEYGCAGGASGTSVAEVNSKQLRKVSAAISDVQFQPREGELILVSGAVGAGKSSLLLALIGEMVRVAGSVRVPSDSVAFQPQALQLLDGTIRHNVMLGIPESRQDEGLLQKALVASQLAADMNNPRNTLYAKRENTMVGKDGTLLSGGQRARTALARSVYSVLSGARLAVLDDPVASVDNEVLRSAWEAAVLEAMKGATRIVAVNSQLIRRLAPSADRLVLLEGGRIVYDGPPLEGLERAAQGSLAGEDPQRTASGRSLGFPETPRTPHAEEGAASPLQAPPRASTPPGAPGDGDGGTLSVEAAARGLTDLIGECEALGKYTQGPASEGAPLQLAPSQWEALRVRLRRLERGCKQASDAPQGYLATLRMLMGFFYHHSALWFPLAAIMEVISAMESAATFSTAEKWDKGTLGLSNTSALVLFVLELVVFTFIMTSSGHVTMMGVTGISSDIRSTVHRTLTSLGMPYFWRGREHAETRIRRILNIRTEDLAVLGKVPTGILQMMALLSFTFSKQPSLLPLALVSSVLLATLNSPKEWIAKKVDPGEREIAAQMEVRILEHFNCISTLRALRCTAALEVDLRPKLMAHSYAACWRCDVERYVGVLGSVVHLTFIASGKLSILYMKSKGAHGAEGLLFDALITSISAVLSMLASVYVPVIMAVDRFRELRAFLDTEFLEDDKGEDPPAEWPTEGRLCLEDVTFRYLPYAPAALQGVSLEVHAREKLGIVGRTGAGKSTLVSLLLRLGPLGGVPPKSGGRILLDGCDIARLRVSRVRRAVGLVPQDPVIFRMSLKDNIAGGADFTDAEVAASLTHCGLDARQLTGKGTVGEALQAELAVSGLSTGQQQMLMAARAIVRRPKVLVLDECTASLDVGMAHQLLQVIGTHCADATVLSIAHRLRFVLRCDRILVLGNGGHILGLDTPANLMREEDGYFAACLRHEQLDDGKGEEEE